MVVAIVYRPFGEVSTQEGTENYMFTGKELDETGLYYYGSRYYDPDLGRFITRDSLMGHVSTPQSLNRFAYCQNNPLKYVDPWGEYGALHDIGNPGDEYTQKVLNESSSSTSGDEGSDSDESNDDSSLPPGFDPNADYWDPKMMPEVIDAVNDQSKDTSDIGLPPGFDPNADYWDPNIMIKVVEAVLAVLGSNLTGVRGTPSPESDEEEDMLDVAVPGFVIICGVSVSVFGTCLFSADMVKGVALVAITGLAVGTLGVGLILGGFILSLYLLDKTANMER
ncbi:MAG: RHS repeat-associated core domain-containing protein [Theionarchaea archaeon]|nr:RHS repeat-associated core domain-containing protein [Theionarchaea archaeon]